MSLIAVGIVWLIPQSAAAIDYGHDWAGRAQYHGYFSNTQGYCNTSSGACKSACPYSDRGNNDCRHSNDGGNVVLPPDRDCRDNPDGYALPVACVQNTDELVSLLKRYNHSKDIRLHASSGFIVQTLLGRDGDEANSHGGRNISAADWADLTERLKDEADAGRICWGVRQRCKTPSDIRTFSVYLVNSSNADVTYYDSADRPQNDRAIIFLDKNGNPLYVLFRTCANPGGTLQGLPPHPHPHPHARPPSCSVSISQPLIDPTARFTATASFTFSSHNDAVDAEHAGDKVSLVITGPAPSDTFYDSGSVRPPPPGGSSTLAWTTPTVGPSRTSGNFAAAARLLDASGKVVVSCSQPFVVANLPYFNVVGGDVETGAGMMENGSCSADGGGVPPDRQGGVVGWSRGPDSFAGAGTQYAAYALGAIQQFATTQRSDLAPDGLSFANTSIPSTFLNPDAGLYGGDIGAEDCMTDYYAEHPSGPPVAAGILTQVPADPSNVVYVHGDETIDLSTPSGQVWNVPNGSHTTMYVDGNVIIRSDIVYTGRYPKVGDIPSFTVVAKGNIYIGPGVSEIDGFFVAEPDVSLLTHAASNGIIYTCTTLPFMPNPPDAHLRVNLRSYYQTCDRHLDVYGAVMARQVWLLRTYGTLYENPPTPAETFHYTPEVWLSPGSASLDSYNSITSLPPVL